MGHFDIIEDLVTEIVILKIKNHVITGWSSVVSFLLLKHVSQLIHSKGCGWYPHISSFFAFYII